MTDLNQNNVNLSWENCPSFLYCACTLIINTSSIPSSQCALGLSALYKKKWIDGKRIRTWQNFWQRLSLQDTRIIVLLNFILSLQFCYKKYFSNFPFI